MSILQLGSKLQLINEFNPVGLRSFHIYDGQYLVFFCGMNTVEVYTISRLIDIRFKMRLPLYQAFSNHTFKLYKGSPVISFKDGFFAILMENRANGVFKTDLLIYGLQYTKHNSFIMSQDQTEFYKDDKEDPIGNLEFTSFVGDLATLAVMSSRSLQLYSIQYFN